MSTQIVRDAVRADWPRLMPAIRYVDTINRSLPRNPPLPLPDIWGTLRFDVVSRRHITMGANPWVEEIGIVTLAIFARSGHGDQPGIAAATAAMHAWDGWTDSTEDVFFMSVDAPRALEQEAEGEWFAFGVLCNYRAQERIQLP